MKGVMQVAVEMVRDDINVYPPATEANSPTRRRWYERGYGPRWRRANGSIGGRRTSETLGRKWATEVRERGRVGAVGNNASYARYVHSHKLQPFYHRRRGWRSDETVAKRQAPRIAKLYRDAIRKRGR